jgi:hypothetical protein
VLEGFDDRDLDGVQLPQFSPAACFVSFGAQLMMIMGGVPGDPGGRPV